MVPSAFLTGLTSTGSQAIGAWRSKTCFGSYHVARWLYNIKMWVKSAEDSFLKNLSSGKDLLDGHSDLGPDSIPGDQGDCSHITAKFRIFKEYYNIYNNYNKFAKGHG